jgi:alanine dehydrogenase
MGEIPMLIGVPKEIKIHEYRVGQTPAAVRELVAHGHNVLIEKNAGIGIGARDEEYKAAGAMIADTAKDIYAKADMIVKVKEPQAAEYGLLRRDQILFTYLHLAAEKELTAALIQSGCIAIAYETVRDVRGRLPLLTPMSEVAGRMAVQVGAQYLEKIYGGRGVLLSGVPGVAPASVVIIGGGVVGTNAARVAAGMGADVVVLDKSPQRLMELDELFNGRVKAIYATLDAIETHVAHADLVVGAVLVPGAAAPRLVTRAMIGAMKKGSVIVDVAIDQGGCIETAKPTTHADPVYTVDGVIHYCVTNMPGAVARTSAFALNNATLPYVLALADKGWKKALLGDIGFREGLNVAEGKVTCKAVADTFDLAYRPAEDMIAAAAG